MSRQIDYTAPLSDEERAWAEQFPGLHSGAVEANLSAFPPEKQETLTGDDEEELPYSEWTKADLQAEARRRNAEEGTNLRVTGTQAELAKALEDDDSARA